MMHVFILPFLGVAESLRLDKVDLAVLGGGGVGEVDGGWGPGVGLLGVLIQFQIQVLQLLVLRHLGRRRYRTHTLRQLEDTRQQLDNRHWVSFVSYSQ